MAKLPRAQLIDPQGNVDFGGGVLVSGATTATGGFSGNFSGTGVNLTGTPNLNVGIVTSSSGFKGSGATLSGLAGTAYVGQTTTSQSGTTTIDLSKGNIVYFNQSATTTVAFANTSTGASQITFIRDKSNDSTSRPLTWPTNILWDGGVDPTLNQTNPRNAARQEFIFLTRDSGQNWYGYESLNANPQTSRVYSWGINNYGQNGQNDVDGSGAAARSSPTQIGVGTDWSPDGWSSNGRAFRGVKLDGTLWGWGRNSSGELGLMDTTDRSSPVQVGRATDWTGSKFSQTFSNTTHVMVVKADGTLWGWGGNSSGPLGLNDTTSYSSPVQVGGDNNWDKVEVGDSWTLALKKDGTMWSWGSSTDGQLGQNNATSYSSPRQIGTHARWSGISAGHRNGAALLGETDPGPASSGKKTLWMWGENTHGILGVGNQTDQSSPQQVGTETDWTQIKVSYRWAIGIREDSSGNATLWTWGDNSYGQVYPDISGAAAQSKSSPVQRMTNNGWTKLFCGNETGFAMKTDGTLWTWGGNTSGQCGVNVQNAGYSSPIQLGTHTDWISIQSARSAILGIRPSE